MKGKKGGEKEVCWTGMGLSPSIYVLSCSPICRGKKNTQKNRPVCFGEYTGIENTPRAALFCEKRGYSFNSSQVGAINGCRCCGRI